MEFVNVIVPLRLDWEPVYRVPQGMVVRQGDRVQVRVAGREYTGVVHRQVQSPDVPESRILPLLENRSSGSAGSLAPITGEELSLWEFVAEYYMCTIGEVYKASYPAARVKVESSKGRRPAAPPAPALHRCKRPEDIDLCRRIYDGCASGRPVLLTPSPGRDGSLSAGQCPAERRIADILAQRTLQEGRSVLILTPEVESAPENYLQYNSSTTAAARRDIADKLRSGGPCVVAGTRMAVFLPFVNLGLIIVLDEHNPAYKQPEPAPRYNARDLAVKLGSLHNAGVLLCSRTPSLESLYNCDTGKYCQVLSASPDAEGTPRSSGEVIDTTSEKRKNGMNGSLSRKLIAAMSECLGQKQRVALLLPWKDTDDIEIEARRIFPEARTRLVVMSLGESRRRDLGKYSLVALLCADYLLRSEDFRADEKALRQLIDLHNAVRGRFVVQTSDAGHPVFRSAESGDVGRTLRAMMPLRAQFGLPPYSRIVDVVFRDGNDARRGKMMRVISGSVNVSGMTGDRLRIVLPKDHSLRSRKLEIQKTVTDIAAAGNYSQFIHFDVDPA